MRRREFIIGGLTGAALAWPLMAGAQQTRRVAVLMGVADDKEGQAALSAFRRGLEELGWKDGGNVSLDISWAAGESESMLAQANELVRRKPDVLLVRGSRALMAV